MRRLMSSIILLETILIMIIGILIGTLSSIFIAAPMLSWFRFSVEGYRALIAAKELRKKEKEKIRAMYEKGRL